ncbi:flagellar biosynthesis protein FlhF [Clostridium sp. 'White wine YQ']|uniref:flagellar biosynthesis protein FlhF n=1 Tax=Clostridium sp. 'White wine YQ' TaxID=3027474 RepID=UPI0023664298|nr:flagellar biosynthesis protein FlhF [Clostridium sp. 'White wine YQ']MDD7794585.1 flagellar biosynthesis protein FlhF [Clostridium sp. 'White wine YQ']
MIIKKYIVKNMNEAMTRIRYELGKDAVILSNRKIRKDGIKGFFSPKLLEVTAAVEKLPEVKTEKKNKGEVENSIDSLRKMMEREISNRGTDNRGSSIEENKVAQIIKKDASDNQLKNEMQEIKSMLARVIDKDENAMRDEFDEFLDERDIEEKYIQEFKNDLNNSLSFEDKKEKLREYLRDIVQIDTKPLSGRVVFIGPTGVGKTTTIAKIAGRLSLIERKKVGLITIDTYRIGAVEQLKTYAEIMGITLEVVITLKEMELAIEKLSDCDVILIDTTGRSSKNKMQLSELRAFVEKAKPDETYLVISSIIKNKDIEIILDGYKLLSYDGIIVTKLDETSVYGGLVQIIKESNTPISYITTGQSVPEDIRAADKEEIVKLILGEDTVC